MHTDKQPSFRIISPRLLEEVQSTYTQLQEMLAVDSELPNGFCIDAAYQTAGRGQQGNSWYASRGKNLLLSFLLRDTPLCPSESVRISDWVALSVAEVVARWGEGISAEEYYKPNSRSMVKVKWPNDIYIGSRKVAGILIAHTLQQQTIVSTICGIGLNVNEVIFPDFLPNPISLFEMTHRELSLDSVRLSLFEALERNYHRAILRLDEGKFIHQLYEEKLYQRGEEASYYDVKRQSPFRGEIRGVDKEGCLLVRDSTTHKERCFAFKEIIYL